jgi:pimeloyl-ACP methyl ester carboxylesterase
MLDRDQPYHTVTEAAFSELGWNLPDHGVTVEKLANAAPGGAFDPRSLEIIDEQILGYQAKWHELRYPVYGLDWDIGILELVPASPQTDLPTLVIVNGGAANWYEFFVDPLNRAGLGQYLAQHVHVLLVTIPGNFRHGGWDGRDFANRIPGYLLDRDVSAEEAAVRNAVYTFRVVSDGVRKAVDELLSGPAVIVGHSTGGELQFMLKNRLPEQLRGLSMGWGSGGPASLDVMRSFRGERSIDDYPHVSRLRARTPEQYAGHYLGPLNPFWDPALSRQKIAERWMGAEERRRAQFKQPLQDIEHSSAINLLDEVAGQIRETLAGNPYGVDASEVIADLFTTMRSPVVDYRKMIWTTARLDAGHWNEEPSAARELLVADAFRAANPGIPVRLLVFDVPMTHYGHIERPRELAGGLLAALRWLAAE